jgi:hypothetical protein
VLLPIIFKTYSYYNDINEPIGTIVIYDHQYECYLNKVIHIKHKRALTKFRLSSTGLRIETGRHGSNMIDRKLRTCQLCNSVDIEDEYHFVLICPCYTDLRIMYIPLYYREKKVCLNVYN